MRARLGMCISELTTARIRGHADKEHKEQDQDIRRQTNLCMLVDCSACICACVCSSVYLCAQAHGCMGCRPACVATLQYYHMVLRPQNRDPVIAMVTAFLNIEHARRQPHQQHGQRTMFLCSVLLFFCFVLFCFVLLLFLIKLSRRAD